MRKNTRRYVAHNSASKGFSLLELVIVIIIISLLFAVAVDKMLALRVDAERVAMENLLGTLRSALGITVAGHIAKGSINELATLAGSNPLDRLSQKPNNYRGAFNAPGPNTIEGGQWYFDSAEKTLIYRVDNSDYFKSALPGPARARFIIKVVYEDINHNGVFDQGLDEINGLSLTEREPYAWTNEPTEGDNH